MTYNMYVTYNNKFRYYIITTSDTLKYIIFIVFKNTDKGSK